jgi:fumarate reductase subunit C
MIVLHAALALRKFPANWRQYRSYWSHMRAMKHDDTSLWMLQVVTGFAMFFLASAHLYVMLSNPELIGPYASSDRVWSHHFWPLYLLLLFMVEIHGGVGLYRLALKWGWFDSGEPNKTRKRLKQLKWSITVFFIALGLATLVAYMKIGIEHQDQAGERYTPEWVSEPL